MASLILTALLFALYIESSTADPDIDCAGGDNDFESDGEIIVLNANNEWTTDKACLNEQGVGGWTDYGINDELDLREDDSDCEDEDGNQVWCHGDFSNIYLNSYSGGQGTLATFYQFFTCPQDSTLAIKYKVAFSGTENEDKIWVRVNGVQIGESIELDRFTLSSPLSFEGESLDGLSYEGGTPFQVEFTLRHSHSNDHIFIYDIQLRCIECSECDASGDVELLEIGDDAVWEARTFTDGDGVQHTQTPTFQQNGVVVALEGAVSYPWATNQISPSCGSVRDGETRHGCAFGSKAYGYIGQIPAIAVLDVDGNEEEDDDGNTIMYTGHYPLENQIFAVINDHGFECSIEVIGNADPTAVDEDAESDGAPVEAEGQIWLRAWTIPENYYDIDPSVPQAGLTDPDDVIDDSDFQWCPLDGIVYIAKGDEDDDEDTENERLVYFDPNRFILSSEILKAMETPFFILLILMMGVVIAITSKIISYCICKDGKKNGYSSVKVVDFTTDSEAV